MKLRYGGSEACAAAAAALFGMAGLAHAQGWPAKPVRIVVPFAAGGGTDIQGRLLGKKFLESTGQTFISSRSRRGPEA